MSQSDQSWNAPQGPRANKGLIAAVGTAVVVLAVIGATAGWVLAGRDSKDTGNPGPSVTPGASAGPSVSVDTGEPSEVPVPSAGSIPSDAFRLPDVTNVDFELAFKQLRALRLGVTVHFQQTGDDRLVQRTVPVAGQYVRKGNTIHLYVPGRTPKATVPGVTGLPCNQAGTIVYDHGFIPRYVTGRDGVVNLQDPAPPNDTARWNDPLKLYCGAAGATPSATASP
jgi:hypothetical protein